MWAKSADWYLYIWSDTKNEGGDVGQFQTTDASGVFRLEGVTTTESSIKFCIHNNKWSKIYGWSQGQEGLISATGVDVALGTSSGATGWIGLSAGTYNVTFNSSALTIRFDTPASESEEQTEYEMPDLSGDYLRGGDVSMLNYVESFGAKFMTADGVEKDPLDIMKDNGVNIVRLRLYNNPGQSVTYGGNTYKVPAGYLNETDVLQLAKRCKAKGLRVELTFHYSDFWTNGENQFKPKDWQDLSFDELKTAVYDYTKQFLTKMKQQGTTPEYVSLGNEIQSGMLFGNNTNVDAVNGQSQTNLAALMAEGSKAVREVCSTSQVVIHLTLNKQWTLTRYISFFNTMKACGLDYDVIGASYYPYWTDQRPSVLDNLANELYQRFQKPLLIMEVGYSWAPYRPYGRNNGNYEGQLGLNGTPYNEATKQGQKTFIQELQSVVKQNDHILGYLYWDPIMIDQQVNGNWIETAWAYRYDSSYDTWWQDGNVVSNTTWFDYEGRALPVFEAIAEDKGTTTGSIVLRRPSLDAAPVYNLQGQQVGTSLATLPTGLYIANGRKVAIK